MAHLTALAATGLAVEVYGGAWYSECGLSRLLYLSHVVRRAYVVQHACGGDDELGAAEGKVKDRAQVPLYSFEGADSERVPTMVDPEKDLKDWASWYAWRKLPMASPAALLMSFPLSVYQLLARVLALVATDSSPEKRQKLEVHYLGVERELNIVPL